MMKIFCRTVNFFSGERTFSGDILYTDVEGEDAIDEESIDDLNNKKSCNTTVSKSIITNKCFEVYFTYIPIK